jgi:hypothetical protein
VPVCDYALLQVSVINPTGVEVDAKLWLTTQAVPTVVDLIEHTAKLAPMGGRAEYESLVASAGEKLFVQADEGCIIRVSSIEKLS